MRRRPGTSAAGGRSTRRRSRWALLSHLSAGRWGEVTLADRTAGLAWAAEAEAGHVQATAALRTAPVRGNLHAGWGCRSPPRGACAPAGPLVARHAPDSQSGGSPIPAPSQGFSPTVREMSVSGQRGTASDTARRPTPAPNRDTSVPENLARCALIGGIVSSREEAFMSHFFGLFLLCLAVTLAVLGNGHKP